MNDIMRLHIRGNMGVQILQTFVALSSLNDNEIPEIYVNTHGVTSGADSEQLTKLFECNFHIFTQDETRKTPYWEPGCATKVFTNRHKILSRWVQPRSFPVKQNLNAAVHVRGKDKPTVSKKSYRYLVDEISSKHENVKVYTDDKDFAETLVANTPSITVSSNSVIEDWVDMFHSNIVYAGPSAFIMSMLLIDTNKHVVFLGDKYCDGGYPYYTNDLLFIREAQRFCPNLEILND